MDIKNAKIFKIDTVEGGTPSGTPSGTGSLVEDPSTVNDEIDALFEMPAVEETDTLGEYVIDQRPEYVTGDEVTSKIPTIDELIARNSSVLGHLDLVKKRYLVAQTDMETLIKTLEDTISQMNPNEARIATMQLAARKFDLITIKQSLERIEPMILQQAEQKRLEEKLLRDTNGDGLIGDKIGVVYDKDGVIHYVDPVTGKAVAAPYLNPDYEISVFGDTVKMIEEDQVIGMNNDIAGLADPDRFKSDIYLQYDTIRPDSGNEFNLAADFKVPELIWTLANDGVDEDPYQFAKELWTTAEDGSIRHIKPASDQLNKYVQKRVAEVKVFTEPLKFKGADGKDVGLGVHIIELYDAEGTRLGRISLEGYFGGRQTPLSTPVTVNTTVMGRGGSPVPVPRDLYYTSATTPMLGIDAAHDLIGTEKKIDCSGLISTGRHIVDNFAETMDMEAPEEVETELRQPYNSEYDSYSGNGEIADAEYNPSNEERAWRVFREHSTFWQDTSYYNEFWQYTTENASGDHRLAVGNWWRLYHSDQGSEIPPYEDYHDRYNIDTLTAYDTHKSLQSGVIIRGRDHIIGTKYNDMIIVTDAKEFYEKTKDFRPAGSEMPQKDDPEYTTIVEGGGGNDCLRAYSGDLYATGVTLAKVDASQGDTVAIEVAKANLTRTIDSPPEEIEGLWGSSIRDCRIFNPEGERYLGRGYTIPSIEQEDDPHSPWRFIGHDNIHNEIKCYVDVSGTEDSILIDKEEPGAALNFDETIKNSPDNGKDAGGRNDYYNGISYTNNVDNEDFTHRERLSVEDTFDSVSEAIKGDAANPGLATLLEEYRLGLDVDDFQFTPPDEWNIMQNPDGSYSGAQKEAMDGFFAEINMYLDEMFGAIDELDAESLEEDVE